MIVAAVFSLVLSEVNSLGEFSKGLSSKKVPILDSSFLHPRHLLWGFHPCLWTFALLGTPSWPSSSISLDLIIWRSGRSRLALVLQDHLSFSKHFIPKMMVLSIVWFLWHIPIYQLPWITAGSSNYLIFYLMILGIPSIWSAQRVLERSCSYPHPHMLIDSLAVPYAGSKFSSSDYPSGFF